MGQNGGRREGSGRKFGGKNKATIEREIIAAQTIDDARAVGKELAKDVLERLMMIAEGATGLNRPTSQAELSAGGQTNPDGDWGRFGEWFDRTAWVANALAKYQSPTFKAIAVYAPPDQTKPGPLMLPAGGKVVSIDDPQALQRVYKNRIQKVG